MKITAPNPTSQYNLDAFMKLPLVSAYTKLLDNGNTIRVMVRRDPDTGQYWTCKYAIRSSNAAA